LPTLLSPASCRSFSAARNNSSAYWSCGPTTPAPHGAACPPGGTTPAQKWCTTFRFSGFSCTALIQRSSVSLLSTEKVSHQSEPAAYILNGSSWVTMRSGVPMPHSLLSANVFGAGSSAGLPSRAPASTHCTMVAISASVSDASFLNCWMPMVRSMNHGGISRRDTLFLMERTHGRTS